MKIPRSFGLVALLVVFCPHFLAGSASAAEAPRYQKSVHEYSVPDVTLLNQNRVKVPLKELVSSDRPVLLQFIFGTCTTICPILSASFTKLQKELGDLADKVRLISISIDPEHDTPEVMKKYLARYRASSGWDFLTGTRSDIDQVMKAFDAWVPDKMSHQPIIFLRSPSDGRWVRMDGFLSAADLMAEYRQAIQPDGTR